MTVKITTPELIACVNTSGGIIPAIRDGVLSDNIEDQMIARHWRTVEEMYSASKVSLGLIESWLQHHLDSHDFADDYHYDDCDCADCV